MREYDDLFDWYTSNRGADIGLAAIEALVENLPQGARVLDAGCGTGIPHGRWLASRGFDVYGVDSSARMIEAFRRNVPDARAEHARIQDSRLFGTTFHAALAWGVLFHLDESEQRLVIGKLAQALLPGGRLLFTSGEERGVREGTMDGTLFRYTSLGAPQYEALLTEHGLRLESATSDPFENFSYVAVRPEARSSRGRRRVRQ